MNNRSIFIAASVFMFSMIVSLVDAVIHPPYAAKIPIKILFFFILPMVFFMANKADFYEFRKLFLLKKSGILKALLLGAVLYTVILLGYFLTRGFIDFSNVTPSLTEGMGITAGNFLYVSLYISLVNSFLEEFFFRGYGFITLKKYTGRKFAYIFSSSIFAVYHVGMLLGMFHIGVLFLLLLGLMIGGCIFNCLNERNDTIYPSWFVHMFANFGINTVGFILFGVL
ncbi:MAG: CPBP family intramembrane metalloprotease [Anaerotignum sp.]|jgi:membrane protease YdiL (CAAX protease family)|nr:CPBP family intramembrane metalloprotease [Anaerotignum sp.]MCI8868205.1 CPBP family intramembrane metalloprotease [Anaerotignum sp.]